MDKYKFWIIFISIITFGAIMIAGILGYSWVNSPTTWDIKVGFDDDTLEVMNNITELSDSFDKDLGEINRDKEINEWAEWDEIS